MHEGLSQHTDILSSPSYQLYLDCALALNEAEGRGFWSTDFTQGEQFLRLQGTQAIDTNSVVAKLNHVTVDRDFIFKMDAHNAAQAANEIGFLQGIAPNVIKGLHTQGHQVVVPGVVHNSVTGKHPWMIQEFIAGKPASAEPYKLDAGALTPRHIEGLCAFIKTCSRLDLGTVEQEGGLRLGEDDSFRVFQSNLDHYGKDAIVGALGPALYGKMSELLANLQFIFTDQAQIFSLGDVNACNMIKVSNECLGLIDFTSVGTINNPAYDYGFLLESLSVEPPLQKHFIYTALRANQDVPYFKDLLRVTFIYSGVINKIRRAYARGDMEQVLWSKQQIEDALLGRGVWEYY